MTNAPPLPKLRSFRLRRGLSQAALASRVGCSEHTIINAEGIRANRGIRLETAVAIADALGASLDDLTGREQYRTN